jgi:hypothetical protein
MKKQNFEEDDGRTYAQALAEFEEQRDNLCESLCAMSKAETKRWCRMQLNDTLRFVCFDVALPNECYELCQAMKKELEARGEQMYDIFRAGVEWVKKG